MRFNRVLTAGLMALICAGTAAASQLNSVHVTPRTNAATITLQTTGSFAHKEYRPDEHLLLVDLTGVTSDPALAHEVALKSPLLKSYTVSSYTNAAGTTVTRVELALGDRVTADVVDAREGLQIQLKAGQAGAVGAAPASSKPAFSAPAAAPVLAAKAAPAKAAALLHPVTPEAMGIPAEPGKTPSELVTIRSVSVQQEQNSVDVVVEGARSPRAYRLKNPERLVLDFNNVVMQPSVKNVAVHTKDVLQVRVGHFQDSPPVTRIVIDLGGPRSFEVVPSGDRVLVRIKTDAASALPAPHNNPVLASGPHFQQATMSSVRPASAKVSDAPAVQNPVPASAERTASPVKDVATPVATSAAPATTPSQVEPAAAPSQPASVAAPAAAAPSQAKAPVEMARLVSPAGDVVPASISSSTAASKPKYTGEPISVNLKDVDLKDFFRLIHEISGLNVVLDPSVRGTVTLVLDDVPWDQALDIVLKNNSLDRELDGNVLRIAASDTLRREAVDRRAQAEAVALAVDRQTITRTLSYARATAAMPTIKKFLTARGDVISDDRTNSLIISDIPSVIPTLDRLIAQLDKKTQEVEIEVRVVSATRSFSRDLGFQLGFNWGNGASVVGGSNPNGATIINTVAPGSTSTTGGTGPITTTNPVPLFSNFPAAGATTGLSFSNITKNYGIDAILTAAESHSLAKVLSRPRVVTQSNVKAVVKQGVEIPVYTSGTANANSMVTYTDAVLRLSVTPQVTADNTIFLTVDVENTQPSGQLNGNFILTTQQASTQVLVTDGGTVVIGGVIQTSNQVSTNQTPLLGDIPWLGNLFKEHSVTTSTEELIFFITPKIIQT